MDESVATKDLIMYFQTTIRNVALTTAVSFAALGYSRFYRGASKMYSAGLSVVSFLLISCSFIINLFLYNSLKDSKKLNEIGDWLIINQIFFIIHTIILLFGLYTMYRLITGKKFK